MSIGIILGILLVVGIVYCLFAWYRIVDPSEAHLVVTPGDKFVVSSDPKVATDQKKTYFAIPSFIPFFGRAVRVMDLTIKEISINQKTFEKDQATYNVQSSTKFRIEDVKTASETFIDDKSLAEQLKEVIKAGVRASTVQYSVVDALRNKKKMEEEVRSEIEKDLRSWGLDLVNFQLSDFTGKIIEDISLRREVEIETNTRQQNAEKYKAAKVKEAEADEVARQREIERDRTIGEQEQLKEQKIAEMRKTAEEKRFEVVKVQIIKQAEIDKEKAIVVANHKKETEKILMEQKKLEGQGDRAKMEEQAKGDAAIRALVAEKVVEKDKEVGIATANALEKADLKVFSGGGNSSGFDLGQMVESMSVADNDTANMFKNRLARPNDLGMKALGIQSLTEKVESSENEQDKHLVSTKQNKNKPKK
jgi:flotillin